MIGRIPLIQDNMLESISKLYTIVLVMLPAINVYRSPIPSIELGTFIVIFCSAFFLCTKQGFSKAGIDNMWNYLLLIFFICTVVSSVILDYDATIFRNVIFRFLKIVVVAFTLFMIGRTQFDYKLAVKTLEAFSILCAVFIIIQYVAHYSLGINIMGVYSPLTSAEGYADYDFNRMYKILFRPSAFFFEPAHFASYEFVYLCYLLSHPNEKYRLSKLGIIIIGILLSTSGTGFAILPVLIIFSIFIQYKNGNFNLYFLQKLIFTILTLSIILLLYFNTDFGAASLQRILNTDGTLGTSATGRLQSGAYELFKQLPQTLQYIGCGFGNRPTSVYFPSLYAILYGDGYIGLCVFILMLLIYFMKAKDFGKMLCLTYSLLFIGTGVFNFASIGLYFSFISQESKRIEYDSLCE